MSSLPEIMCMGEVMLEVSQPTPTMAALKFGGDTLNTAVYLARLGKRAAYVTALGGDPYSDDIVRGIAAEGIDTGFIARHADRQPGLYAIKTDETGERSFHYWRENSAAQDFMAMPEADRYLAAMAQADWIYLSGITLSLFDQSGRERLYSCAQTVMARGGQVVFDMNYRPKRWANAGEAQEAAMAMARHASVILPTGEDDDMLFGAADEGDHVARWAQYGAQLVVVKRGAQGCMIYPRGGAPLGVRPVGSVTPLDTTGAGDSFNGGFLAALMDGASLEDAGAVGNRVAGTVIQHHGAIIDRTVSLGG